MPDPNSRSSEGPELPLAEGGDEASSSEGNGSADEDAETVDYETAEEEDWYVSARAMRTECQQWSKRKPETPEELVSDLKAFHAALRN